ncbi:MAG: cytochrome c peroxidase [Bryobacteraceae bacterium]
MKLIRLTFASTILLAPMLAQKWPSVPGYEEMKYPADNPMTEAKVELGKMLYFDKRLSGDGTRSCYYCHVKEKGLTDGQPTAIGAFEAKLPRAAPTMWNVGYYPNLYWDGRAPSLERQVLGAWSGGNMGATGANGRPSVDDMVGKLNQIAGYKPYFQKAFSKDSITKEDAAKAIACFMRTIVSVDSPWVKFRNGDKKAFSGAAQRGWAVFNDKAKCSNCHDGRLLTDAQFHNVGIGTEKEKPDVGRFTVTKDEKDTSAFKTPTLLDISKSAPYFHDGSAKTLEDAVDFMLKGGRDNKHLDKTNLKPYKATPKERADLLAFLRSLTVNYSITEPTLP